MFACNSLIPHCQETAASRCPECAHSDAGASASKTAVKSELLKKTPEVEDIVSSTAKHSRICMHRWCPAFKLPFKSPLRWSIHNIHNALMRNRIATAA